MTARAHHGTAALHPGLGPALQAALGGSITDAQRLGGGDINEAWAVRLTTADGPRRAFVKARRGAERDTFTVEARGLRWLAEPGVLRIPTVLAVGEDPPFLALELVETGAPTEHTAQALGRGLAALHRAAPPSFGLDHDDFIARLRQDNTPGDDWPSFYWERRLLPMLQRAEREGLCDAALRHDFDRLATRLPERCGPTEPPARLHGDLWSGNLLVDAHGAPVLIDPAVYGGHREIDLAMMRLFGGFSPRTFEAYAEAWPLAPGWEQRVPLYQLYPLLVHVNLFGRGYLDSVRAALRQVL
ncbi:fructosamine kinase family protein [Paraliomyxa miuraensis]|uniref:fructosamine kinase family protein n=1 Tax=Paraliomyxa miuraensis TaxID=376150 RepID=UPI002251052D|nr:fructosamine kinase family protein [Paraliomyxa miuraensis]MCX4240767.1 fructosamine kinase family protein [Paraliomyxa miuraensis]